jgi:hypothetical protein
VIYRNTMQSILVRPNIMTVQRAQQRTMLGKPRLEELKLELEERPEGLRQ